MKAIAEADSVEDVLLKVAGAGGLLRLDDDVWPTMYRCSTVTTAELEQLRGIKDIVRKGHVQSMELNRIVLDQGEEATPPNTLHVDCTADGLERRPSLPVFDGAEITLQAERTCQQVFSAAFIGHVEAAYSDAAVKNELCTPVPHPDSEVDFLRSSLANTLNAMRWGQDAELKGWLKCARLDGFSRRASQPLSPETAAEVSALTGDSALASVENLQKLLTNLDA